MWLLSLLSGRYQCSTVALVRLLGVVFLLEDYKEAILLPVSNKEFFTLQCYQEELGKDFKRITLFLCTLTDFKMSEGGITADVQESEEQLWDLMCVIYLMIHL